MVSGIGFIYPMQITISDFFLLIFGVKYNRFCEIHPLSVSLSLRVQTPLGRLCNSANCCTNTSCSFSKREQTNS